METCSLLVWLIVWLKEAQSLASAGTKTASLGLACWAEPQQDKIRAPGWVDLLRYDERILTGGGHTLKH